MIIKFSESTRDNPLNYFEDFFTVNGQKKSKAAFLSSVLPRIEQYYFDHENEVDYSSLDYDLENEIFQEYLSGMDQETGEDVEEIREYTYLNYLKNILVNPEAAKFKLFLKQRIDGCDGVEQEQFVLRKMLGKIVNMSDFLDQHAEVPFRDKLKKFVSIMQKHIELYAEEISPVVNASNPESVRVGSNLIVHATGKEKKLKRLSELSCHVPSDSLMEFLKKEDFIRCSKGEVAKVNYYFGIGNAKKKPSSKIVWQKDPELLKMLIKIAYNQGPKYMIAASVFEVEGITEEEILGWTNRNVKKIKDSASELKLKKFIQKYIAESVKKTNIIESPNDVVMD